MGDLEVGVGDQLSLSLGTWEKFRRKISAFSARLFLAISMGFVM